MATPDCTTNQNDMLLCACICDSANGESGKSVGSLIEKKIDFLERLTYRVSKRRTRRYLNDRLLIELVPRLNAEEIRGLFSRPPFGDDVQVSPFCLTKVGVRDRFGNTDMDIKDSILKGLDNTSKKKSNANVGKGELMNAWHRIDLKTREALRRCYLSDLIEGYEHLSKRRMEMLKFLSSASRTLFFASSFMGCASSMASVTETYFEGSQILKMTKITKKKPDSAELPSITFSHFMRMSKEGV